MDKDVLRYLHIYRLPWWLSGKESTCNAGDTEEGFDHWVRKIPGGGHGNPLQYSCLENSMDREAWWATVRRVAKSRTRLSNNTHTHTHTHTHTQSPWGCKELDMTEQLSLCNVGHMGLIPGLGRCPGEGNSNPLQYSCLENPMDRGAWRAIAHGFTKESDTTERLSFFIVRTCTVTN